MAGNPMTARLSNADLRRLGLAAPKRTTRKTARGPYLTECVLCAGSRFTTQAAENRHLEATGHPRYALILSETPDA
jgi:hypothetical protein